MSKKDNSSIMKWLGIIVGLLFLYFTFFGGFPTFNASKEAFNVDDYGTTVSDSELNRFEVGYTSDDDMGDLENAIMNDLSGSVQVSSNNTSINPTEEEKNSNDFYNAFQKLNNATSIRGQWSYVVTKSEDDITTYVSDFNATKVGVVWTFKGTEKERRYPDSGLEIVKNDIKGLLSLLPKIPTYDKYGNVVTKQTNNKTQEEKEWQLPVSMKTYHPVIALASDNFEVEYVKKVDSTFKGVGVNNGMKGFLSKKFKGYTIECLETSYKVSSGKIEEYSIYELTKWGKKTTIETSVLLSY